MKNKNDDSIKISTGKLNAEAASSNGKYPFFTCSKDSSKVNSYSFDTEAVLLAGNGDLNAKYYFGKFDAYQRTYVIESPNKEWNVKYLYYGIYKSLIKLKNMTNGGVIQYIKLGDIFEMLNSIEKKNLIEQKRISNILTCLDNNISIVEEKINKLEMVKKGVSLSLIKNNKFSLLKEISLPITKGTTPSTEGFKSSPEDSINFIKIDALRDDVIPRKTKAKISLECHNKLKRSQLEENDILFSIAGSLGVVALVKKENLPANTNQAFSIIRLKNKSDVNFIYQYLKSDFLKTYISENTTKGAIPNLNLEQIGNIPIPTGDELVKIGKILEEFDLNEKKLFNKKKKLEQIKKGLMERFFNE